MSAEAPAGGTPRGEAAAGVAGLLNRLAPPNRLDAGVALAAAPPPEAAGVEAGVAAGVFEKAPPKALGFGAADASPAGFDVDPNNPPPAVPPDAPGWLKTSFEEKGHVTSNCRQVISHSLMLVGSSSCSRLALGDRKHFHL